jgi:hypothetical protein
MENGWALVYTSTEIHNIEIVKAILGRQNIDSVSIDKKDSIYVSVGHIELFVREEDALLARIIIEQEKL